MYVDPQLSATAVSAAARVCVRLWSDARLPHTKGRGAALKPRSHKLNLYWFHVTVMISIVTTDVTVIVKRYSKLVAVRSTGGARLTRPARSYIATSCRCAFRLDRQLWCVKTLLRRGRSFVLHSQVPYACTSSNVLTRRGELSSFYFFLSAFAHCSILTDKA